MQEAEATNPSRGSYDPQVGTRIPVHCICSCVQSFYKHPCDPQTLMHTHVMCLTSAQPCTWKRVSQPGASCSPDTLHRTSSPRCVSPGSTSPALQLLNLLYPASTCLAHVPGHSCQSSVFPCTCQHVCRKTSTSPTPAPPPPFSRRPEIPSPHSGPGTHSDRSLIHIFLLGADFSSRGDGQSDSSISGGLQGDSSMLSLCLRNRGRRQHRGSASAPHRKTLTPIPAPSHLRLAWTSQAGISRLSPSWQSCSSCGCSSPAAQLWAPGPSSPRRRCRAQPEPPPRSPLLPRPVPPPSVPLPSPRPARSSLTPGSHSSQGNDWKPGAQRDKSARGRARAPRARGKRLCAPAAGGCKCVFTQRIARGGGGRTSLWVLRGSSCCAF